MPETSVEPAPPKASPLSRLIRDVAVYGLGDALVKSSTLLTMPLYTRAMGPEGYGLLGLAFTTAALAQVLLGMGLESAYARFFFQHEGEGRRDLTRSVLWVAVGPAFTLGFLLAAAAPWAMHWYLGGEGGGLAMALAMVSVPFSIANGLLGQVLRNQFKAELFSLLNFVSGVLQVSCAVGLGLGLGLGVPGVVGGLACAQILMLPVRLWGLRGELSGRFQPNLARKLLAFGLPLVPTSLAFWVFNAADRYVLGWLASVAETGLYTVAATLAGALNLVSTALSQAMTPITTQLYEQDKDQARVAFGGLLVHLMVAFGALAMGLAAGGPELVALVASPSFAKASAALGPLALSVGALATTQITASGISLSNQTMYFAVYSWTAAWLNLVLNLAFVSQWGLLASAWATFASSAYLSLAYAATSQRLWPIVYPWRKLLVAGLPPVAFVALLPCLAWPSGWVGWAIRAACLGLYPLLLILGGVWGPNEWAAVRARLKA